MRGAELAEHPVDDARTVLIFCGCHEGPIPLRYLLPIETMESPVVEPVAYRLPDLVEDLQLRGL